MGNEEAAGPVSEMYQHLLPAKYPASWLADKRVEKKELLLTNECEQSKAHLESISVISLFPTQACITSQLHRGPLLWAREQNPALFCTTASVSLSRSPGTGPVVRSNQAKE